MQIVHRIFCSKILYCDVCSKIYGMKAIVINRFGPPAVLEEGEIEKPDVKEDELIIRVKSGSVNPVDWKQRKGNHRFLFGAKFPIVLGYDVAGKVIETGSGVDHFQKGDYVCGVLPKKSYGGGMAEYVSAPEKCFARIPENEGSYQYAVLPLAGLTSLQALRDKGEIKKGDRILIIGAAGGVGHYAVQFARIFGAEIFAVSSESHRPFLEKLAKTHFIDYHRQDILQLNEKFDVIYDGVGKYTFLKCKHLLKPGGIYINTLPRPKMLVHKLLSLFTRRKKIRGILMKQRRKDLAQLVSWVEEGTIRLCIDREFSIHEAAEAHAYSEAGHTEGKILIRYNW